QGSSIGRRHDANFAWEARQRLLEFRRKQPLCLKLALQPFKCYRQVAPPGWLHIVHVKLVGARLLIDCYPPTSNNSVSILRNSRQKSNIRAPHDALQLRKLVLQCEVEMSRTCLPAV